jgi:hypothetical protein
VNKIIPVKALADETLTPEGAARSVARQIAEMKIPQERRAFARDLLANFAKTIAALRANDDDHVGLRQAASQLFRRAQELARPIPVPKISDIVRSIFDSLQAEGWGSGAIGLLERDLKPEDLPIKSYDATSVMTATRRIELEALITKYRPTSMTPDHFEQWRKSNLRPDYATRREPSLHEQLKHGSY